MDVSMDEDKEIETSPMNNVTKPDTLEEKREDRQDEDKLTLRVFSGSATLSRVGDRYDTQVHITQDQKGSNSGGGAMETGSHTEALGERGIPLSLTASIASASMSSQSRQSDSRTNAPDSEVVSINIRLLATMPHLSDESRISCSPSSSDFVGESNSSGGHDILVPGDKSSGSWAVAYSDEILPCESASRPQTPQKNEVGRKGILKVPNLGAKGLNGYPDYSSDPYYSGTFKSPRPGPRPGPPPPAGWPGGVSASFGYPPLSPPLPPPSPPLPSPPPASISSTNNRSNSLLYCTVGVMPSLADLKFLPRTFPLSGEFSLKKYMLSIGPYEGPMMMYVPSIHSRS
jgi:hypothetical protein